jgi:small-conductance mechanosensitive channel
MLIEFQNPLNSSALAFPILECIHIVGFALSIGTVAIVDFRLLDIGMRHQTPAQLNKDLSVWTIVGLSIMVLTGMMLYSSDPDMYYLNWAFLLKMLFLVLAIVFNYTVHRNVVLSGASPGKTKMVAYVSLALWILVIFGGIFIGFLNPTLDINKV